MEDQTLALLMCAGFLGMLFLGVPVAIALLVSGFAFGYLGFGMTLFNLLPPRIYGVATNYTLMAVPLFVFMGVMLEQSRLAEDLLDVIGFVCGRLPGGMGLSIVLVGVLMGASTGIVGATVVTLGLLTLPVFLKRNYSKAVACGVICSSGTLGQIIPPSLVLILLADILAQSVGTIFAAAMIPGLVLALIYLGYVLVIGALRPDWAPPIPKEERDLKTTRQLVEDVFKVVLPPILLILAVLGSIIGGVAAPTEAASMGAGGSLLIAALGRRLDLQTLSSTVLAAKLLETKRELGAFHGRTAIGILIVQDIIALVVLAVWSGQTPNVWALLVFAVPLLRPVLHWLLDFAGHDELLVLMGMLLSLVIGGMGFEAIGLSSEIGALVMGVLLSTHSRAKELGASLWSLKEIFLVGFFLQIGLTGLPDWGALAFAVAVAIALALIYTCMALPLACFHFRHGLPLAPRSMLYPLLGERIRGQIGHVVDIVATVGTLFGVGTSLGLGAMQINDGQVIGADTVDVRLIKSRLATRHGSAHSQGSATSLPVPIPEFPVRRLPGPDALDFSPAPMRREFFG